MFHPLVPTSMLGNRLEAIPSLALLLAVISTIFIIPVIVTYARTGLVPNFPTLIVCGFVYLTAIIAFFAGLILSSIVHQERQNFEIRLIACQHRYELTLNRNEDEDGIKQENPAEWV